MRGRNDYPDRVLPGEPDAQPIRASIDQVRITREGKAATIEHADATIATTHLTIGDEIAGMSDTEILDAYNAVIGAQEQLRCEWDKTVVEFPPGKPQIKLNRGSGQWVPQGEVFRCIIEDNSEGEAVICIDDMELSLREFGRLLTSTPTGKCAPHSHPTT